MEWFQIYVNDLSNRLLSAATSSAVGAWVRMLANCYRLENGGCFEQCSEHTARQWMSIAGVDRAEVDEVVRSGLADWKDGGLVVYGYDLEQQQKATERKEKGREMALARWGHAASNAASNAGGNTKEKRGKKIKEEEKRDPPLPPKGGQVLELVSSLSRSSGGRSRRRSGLDSLYTETFQKFWAAYPRKAAKLKAALAWKSRGLDQHLDAILAALEWQRKTAQWTRDDGDKIPYPTTYLVGGRWEDEPSAYPAASKAPAGDIRVGQARAEDSDHSGPLGEIQL